MHSPNSIERPILVVFTALIWLFGQANSQIFGCGSVSSCPPSPETCFFGPHQFKNIGVAETMSTLASDPLTWTVAVDSVPYWGNDSHLLYDRTYILGTPPSVNLTSLQSTGCALLFDAAQPLTFGGELDGASSGTCGNALGDSCVSDLIAQAKARAIVDKNPTIACSRLRDAMRNSTPPSCAARTGSWSIVDSVALTGASAERPDTDGTCRPSTRNDYNLTIVSNEQKLFDSGSAAGRAFSHKITPVLTIFFSNKNDSKAALSQPDASLTCIKPIAANSGLNNHPVFANVGMGVLLSLVLISSVFSTL